MEDGLEGYALNTLSYIFMTDRIMRLVWTVEGNNDNITHMNYRI